MTDREIVLVDMDCFYVQVEQRLNPSLKGKPCAVVQYKAWKGGGIIAVGYEARAFGVTRQMRGEEAIQKCPDIQLARVPEFRGKANLTRYRDAGAEVVAVFSKYCTCVERASIDEAYLDLTTNVTEKLNEMATLKVEPSNVPNTRVEGYDGIEGTEEWLNFISKKDDMEEKEIRLAVAAMLVEDLRKAVVETTGFTCSAGIAHNKMLAKLACGRNKPDKQTVLPHSSVASLFASFPLQKVRHLGGKLGSLLMEDFKVQTMGDLVNIPEQTLQSKCGFKTGSWLYNACRGFEHEAVSARTLAKSIGCGKNFRGKAMLDTKDKVKSWLSELSKELSERLNKDKDTNNRTAKSLTVCLRYQGTESSTAASRACSLQNYDNDKILTDAFALLQKFNVNHGSSLAWTPPITTLGLSATKFVDISAGNNQTISNMFATFRSTQEANASSSKSETANSFTQDSLSEDNVQLICEDKNTNNFAKQQSGKLTCSNLKNDEQIVNKGHRSIASFFSETKKDFSAIDTKNKPTMSNTSKDIQSASPKIQGFFARKMQEALTKSSAKSKSDISNNKQSTSAESVSVMKDKVIDQLNVISENSVCDDQSQPLKGNGGSEVEPLFHHEGMKNGDTNDNDAEQFFCRQDNSNSDIDSPATNVSKYFLHELKHPASPCLPEDFNDLASFDSIDTWDVEDYMECDKCKKMIAMWNMPEHSDFHLAMELSQELGSRIQGSSLQQSSSSSSSLVHKRKSLSPKKGQKGGKKKKIEDKNTRPLTAFYNKK